MTATRRVWRLACGVAVSLFLGAVPSTQGGELSTDGPAVLGLDHIPIAVANLEEAAARYRALGFTLKPGRPHANGIRSQHAKSADGTELELITAAESRDALTATYRRHMAQGDGPAFLASYAPSRDAAAARLDSARVAHGGSAPYLDFEDRDGLGYLFPRSGSSFRPDGSSALRCRCGVSLQVVLARGELLVPARVTGPQGPSVFVPPALTHGLWLEFRESP